MNIIGIVCMEMHIDKNGYNQKVNMVANSYIEMLIANDAVPMMISPQMKIEHLDEIVEKIGGLMLIGGEVARCEKMLSNPGFLNKAPKAKVEQEQEKLKNYKEMLNKVLEKIK